eukprot:756141-Hanusia_phi.AAC.6
MQNQMQNKALISTIGHSNKAFAAIEHAATSKRASTPHPPVPPTVLRQQHAGRRIKVLLLVVTSVLLMDGRMPLKVRFPLSSSLAKSIFATFNGSLPAHHGAVDVAWRGHMSDQGQDLKLDASLHLDLKLREDAEATQNVCEGPVKATCFPLRIFKTLAAHINDLVSRWLSSYSPECPSWIDISFQGSRNVTSRRAAHNVWVAVAASVL